MRKSLVLALASAIAVAGLASTASAGFTYANTTTAQPTYANVLNFDAPGSPTGPVAGNAFSSSGVAWINSGVDETGGYVGQVNTTPGYGWLGTGNVFEGPYGVFIKFNSQISEFSTQFWDNSGPGSFFGGGAAAVMLKNGEIVGDFFFQNPAFSPTAKSWFNVVGDNGSTFDEIRFLGYGFSPISYVDNLSWTEVPAPSAAALLALSGLVAGRRRRA